MASYNVVLYLNTGFSAINVPDSPATLAGAGTIVNAPAIHVLQNIFLSQVDIATSWSVAESVDYLSIGDFYYSVTGVQMLSESTVRFYIVPDFITSAGGFDRLSILDGITSRATVDSDDFGAYTDEDPLTAPQKPLVLYGQWMAEAQGGTTYIQTTLDLKKQNDNREGETYTDAETGEDVTTPKLYSITTTQQTSVSISGAGTDDGATGLTDGTAYYIESLDALGGRAQARGLTEGAIIAQWKVPDSYATYTADDADGSRITALIGVRATAPIAYPYEYDTTVQNKRVLYGQYNRYGIITAAGNSMECTPEDLRYGTTDTQPTLERRVDPRPDGKPYYRFLSVNGNSDFWRNCISGDNWATVPLVYTQAAGSTLTRLNFNNRRRVESALASQYTEQNKVDRFNSFVENMTGGLIHARTTANTYTARAQKAGISASNSAIGIGAAAVGNLISGGINYSIANEQSLRELENYRTNYAIAKANELSELYQATDVYEPQVVFPYNSSIIRDVKGNGVFAYRYEYAPEDIARIDKLLTMYGYKETEPLTTANFSRRTYFDYVECSTVTVTGLPKWHCEGISAQLTNGVRIWHTKPDASHYSSNPIKETT